MTEPVRPRLLGEGWPPESPGGLNRYVSDLLGALRGAEIDARAIVIGPVASPPAGVLVAGHAGQFLPRRLWLYARAAKQAMIGADVLDVHFALYGLVPLLRSPKSGVPLVVHFHGPWAREGQSAGGQRSLATWVKRFVERRVYRRADAVVTLSSAFRQLVVEDYGVSPWRVRVVPPAVDLDRFHPDDPQQVRAALSVHNGTQVVVTVRRLTARMGIENLLDVWAALPTSGLPRLLLIGGEGPHRRELESRVQRLNLSETVRFLGALTEAELVTLYQGADVCVVPSIALEGFGLVVLEALACATPVIATDVGGLPEALASLAPDAVVPAGRVDLLTDRLEGALSGRWPLPSPQACRAHAQSYSLEALASAHVELYEAAARRQLGTGLRVVYLDHCALLSGAEIALLRLINALPEVSAHVVLADDGPLVGRLHRAGISVEVLPMHAAARKVGRERVRPGGVPLATAVHSATYVVRLAHRLRRLKPDLVHCNSLKSCLYGSLAARAAGVPAVWHARDRMAEDYLPGSAARVVRSAFRVLPQGALANSEATLTTFGTARRRARPEAVVADPFHRQRPVTALPEGPLRVGIVGRLAPWKGQHVVLSAFARAFPDGEQRCVVVGAALFGEDDYANELIEQAHRLGISERVEFRGFREDVESEIDALHVLVHASVIPEPFGQVIVEGMAAGRVVIASATGGPTEIITDGVDGLLCIPNDPEALAKLLRRLASDATLRASLCAGARRRAADFNPVVIGSAVDAVYREVLRGR